MSSSVSTTELKFDLSRLAAADFPRPDRTKTGSTFAVLPLIVTQCPWGNPADLRTWTSKVDFRTLAPVMAALQREAMAARVDPAAWTFDMSTLVPDDLDVIDAASRRGQVRDGARMVAKYAAGVPVGLLDKTRPLVAKRLAAEEAAGRPTLSIPTGDRLTALDVLELNYYGEYLPVILKLQKEAQEEFQTGFLDALAAASVASR